MAEELNEIYAHGGRGQVAQILRHVLETRDMALFEHESVHESAILLPVWIWPDCQGNWRSLSSQSCVMAASCPFGGGQLF